MNSPTFHETSLVLVPSVSLIEPPELTKKPAKSVHTFEIVQSGFF